MHITGVSLCLLNHIDNCVSSNFYGCLLLLDSNQADGGSHVANANAWSQKEASGTHCLFDNVNKYSNAALKYGQVYTSKTTW